MKKASKIALIVVGAVVVFLALAIICADMIASRMVNKTVQEQINADSTTTTILTVGDIHVRLLSGCIDIDDIYLSSDTTVVQLQDKKLVLTNAPAAKGKLKKTGMAVYIPRISVLFIDYVRYLKHREIDLYSLVVREPQIAVSLDEKNPESCLPVFSTSKSEEPSNIDITKWLKKAELSNLEIDCASAQLQSVRTKMVANVDSLSLDVNGLAFNLLDSAFSYNDSVYELSLQHAYFRLPDGSAEVDTRGLQTEDAGALKLGKTRFRNLISSVQMAEKAHDYVTWVDLSVNRVQTSAFNPIRKALAQDFTLDSVYADVQLLHVIRDQHIDPKCPFPTPQEILMQIPAKFAIKNVAAKVNTINVEFTMDARNYGKLDMNGLNAKLKNVSNKRNTVWTNHVHGSLGGGSELEATFDLHMDKASNFDVAIQGTNIEINVLNDFLRPIVGLSCESHVDTLRTHYTGDNKMAKGDFLMMYRGLEVQFHKDQDISVKEIRNFGGLIQGFANNLVPKSNPTLVDAAPRKYAVEWKRDEYKPYPLFVVGPCIMGVVQTMLPGLYVHKQIREK